MHVQASKASYCEQTVTKGIVKYIEEEEIIKRRGRAEELM
jgi:hypothetical protein